MFLFLLSNVLTVISGHFVYRVWQTILASIFQFISVVIIAKIQKTNLFKKKIEAVRRSKLNQSQQVSAFIMMCLWRSFVRIRGEVHLLVPLWSFHDAISLRFCWQWSSGGGGWGRGRALAFCSNTAYLSLLANQSPLHPIERIASLPPHPFNNSTKSERFINGTIHITRNCLLLRLKKRGIRLLLVPGSLIELFPIKGFLCN